MAGVPAAYYMENKLSKPGIGLGFFHPDALARIRPMLQLETIRGSCEDYRACASDFEMDMVDCQAGAQDRDAVAGHLGRQASYRQRSR